MVEEELGTEAMTFLHQRIPGKFLQTIELNQTQESTFISDQSLSIKERLKLKQSLLKSKKSSYVLASEEES